MTGVELIQAERKRQSYLDSEDADGELAFAAARYAIW
jgi:hypothetical protein